MEKGRNYLNDLYNLIEYYVGGDKNKFSGNLSVNFDLGLDGDDADEFLKAYSKKFQVDLSNFNFTKYFQPEGISFFQGLYSWLFLKNKQIPLTISDLIVGIENGKLE